MNDATTDTNSPAQPAEQPAPPADARRVLVTGAAGRIGSYFAEHSADRYRLRLMVMPGQDASKISRFGEVVEADMADLAALRRACEGIDTVVHLAGEANPNATWDRILNANIIGTYNVFVSAIAAKCKRVIYASSIHAVSGYPPDVQVKPTDPVNPGDLYGVSKCFGEALASYVAGQEGLCAIAIRICGFQPPHQIEGVNGLKIPDAWVSPRDLTQLIQKSIAATQVRFAIVHGLSDCQFKRLDISNARELLSYQPLDDAFKINKQLRPLGLDENIIAHSLSDKSDPAKSSGLRDQLPKTN